MPFSETVNRINAIVVEMQLSTILPDHFMFLFFFFFSVYIGLYGTEHVKILPVPQFLYASAMKLLRNFAYGHLDVTC